MMLNLTEDQENFLWDKICRAEEIALNGSRAQVWYDTFDGDFWVTMFAQGETYMPTVRSQTYIKLWEVEPHTLKDLGADEGFEDYPWDDENFIKSYEYFEIEDLVLQGEFPDIFDPDGIVDHIVKDTIIPEDPEEDEEPRLITTINLKTGEVTNNYEKEEPVENNL